MRIGFAPAGRRRTSTAVDLARRAEEAGFAEVWVSEDYLERGAFAVAGGIAAATSSVTVGLGVINPWTRHVALAAMESAALDELSRGRLVIGLGASNERWMTEQLGIPFEAPIRHLAEYTAALRILLSGQRLRAEVGGHRIDDQPQRDRHQDGADSAVIAYFGDGASSQGDVAEAFTFSAVYNAPVVFFCQNNQWAISEPNERQMRVPLYQRAQGFGFPGVRVDGNDVLACLAVTKWALERARNGEGPTLVEAFTYRMGAHTTSDDPTKYRADEERAAWEAKDPILRVRAYMEKQGLADAAYFTALDEESEALGKRVREAVRAMPDPDPTAMFEHTYADGSPLVDEERAQFAAYQASFAEEGN